MSVVWGSSCNNQYREASETQWSGTLASTSSKHHHYFIKAFNAHHNPAHSRVTLTEDCQMIQTHIRTSRWSKLTQGLQMIRTHIRTTRWSKLTQWEKKNFRYLHMQPRLPAQVHLSHRQGDCGSMLLWLQTKRRLPFLFERLWVHPFRQRGKRVLSSCRLLVYT